MEEPNTDCDQAWTSRLRIASIACCTKSPVILRVDKGIVKILAPISLRGRFEEKILYLPNRDSITSDVPSKEDG